MMIRSGPREDKSLAQFVTIALDGCTDGADVSRAGLHDGQARPDLVYVGAVLFPVETDMPAVSADQDDGGLFDEQSFGGERRGPSVPEHAVFRGLAVVCPGEGQRYRSVKTDIRFLYVLVARGEVHAMTGYVWIGRGRCGEGKEKCRDKNKYRRIGCAHPRRRG